MSFLFQNVLFSRNVFKKICVTISQFYGYMTYFVCIYLILNFWSQNVPEGKMYLADPTILSKKGA